MLVGVENYVAHISHNLEVRGSNPLPATNFFDTLLKDSVVHL